MDSFFDLIFDNPFLLFFILAMIFSFFSRGKKAEKQQGQQTETPRKETARPTLSETMKRAKEMMETFDFPFDETEEEKPKPTLPNNRRAGNAQQTNEESPVTAQQQRLYDALKQYEDVDDVSNLAHRSVMQQTLATNIEQNTNDNQTKEVNLPLRLTQEGLVESIIMAEVLGPPRARKRYGNSITRRTSL